MILLCLNGGPHAAQEARDVPPEQTPTVSVTVAVEPESLAEKLINAIDIGREEYAERLTPALVRVLHARAISQLTGALQSFGYYRARIADELKQEHNVWQARYVVEKGAPTVYRHVSVSIEGQGVEEPGLRRAISEFPVVVGGTVDHEVYENGKNRLLRHALELGYLEAVFSTHEIRISESRETADVTLVLDSGRQFRFGEIALVQDIFEPAFLHKYVDIDPGEPYSFKKLLDLENVFRDTQYFASVDVRSDPKDAVDYRVPVTVYLEPGKPSAYTFGLGFGTDSGVRGKVGWLRRRVNRHGHRFETELSASEISQSFSAQYNVPIRNPQHDRLSWFAGYSDDDPNNSNSEVGRVGLRLSTVQGNTTWGYSLLYQHETYSVSDVSDTVDMVIPGLEFIRTISDDRLYPRRGARISVELRGALNEVLSDISFGQIRVQGKMIRAPWPGGRILLRGDVAYTQADELDELPATIRFFAGGDQSVRGFDYNELGVTDDNGEVIGGRHLLVGSVEYEHAVGERFAVAAFLDTGNAINALNDDLEQGAGVGLRWKSPVGPVRLDIASAISRPGNPVRVHITVGPDL